MKERNLDYENKFRTKLIKKITQLTELKPLVKPFELEDSGECVLFSKNNVVLVVARTYSAREILKQFDLTHKHKEPSLSYLKIDSESYYNPTYLRRVFEFFDYFKEFPDFEEHNIKLSVGEDYPITAENKHFRIIVAPKINFDGRRVK